MGSVSGRQKTEEPGFERFLNQWHFRENTLVLEQNMPGHCVATEIAASNPSFCS